MKESEKENHAFNKIQDHKEGSLQWLHGCKEMMELLQSRVKRLGEKYSREMESEKPNMITGKQLEGEIKSCEQEIEKYKKAITRSW